MGSPRSGIWGAFMRLAIARLAGWAQSIVRTVRPWPRRSAGIGRPAQATTCPALEMMALKRPGG